MGPGQVLGGLCTHMCQQPLRTVIRVRGVVQAVGQCAVLVLLLFASPERHLQLENHLSRNQDCCPRQFSVGDRKCVCLQHLGPRPPLLISLKPSHTHHKGTQSGPASERGLFKVTDPLSTQYLPGSSHTAQRRERPSPRHVHPWGSRHGPEAHTCVYRRRGKAARCGVVV